MSSGPAVGIDEDEVEELVERLAAGTVINMGPWVNQVQIFLRRLFSCHLI